MDVTLTLEQDDHGVVAHAAVTKAGGVPQRLVNVRFFLNGKASKPVAVDRIGIAKAEFGKLKPGIYDVRAEVIGVVSAVAVENITVGHAKPKQTGMFGLVMMLVYWVLVLFFIGPGFLLTVVYLGITMGALALVARVRHMHFSAIVGNNDWVFFATLAMATLSLLMDYWNPLVPAGVFGWLSSLLWSSEGASSDSVFWGIINNVFFGEYYTHGWGNAALMYLILAVPAFCVSFWDEAKKLILGFFLGHTKSEFLNHAKFDSIFGVAKMAFNRIFGGGNH